MGRKGVSKRKPSKPKNVAVASGAGTVSSIARETEATLPHPVAKGEAISSTKKGKKK